MDRPEFPQPDSPTTSPGDEGGRQAGFDAPIELSCAGCGTPFGKVFDWGRCTRCGVPLSVSRMVAVGEVLRESQPCVGCGYELLGLAPMTPCPECALPVIESMRGIRLRHESPSRLRQIERGLATMLAASAVLLFVRPLGTAIRHLIPAGGPARPIADFVIEGLWFVLAAAVLIGTGMLAGGRESQGSAESPVRRDELRRKRLRWAIGLSAVSESINIVLAALGTSVSLSALMSWAPVAPGATPMAAAAWGLWILAVGFKHWIVCQCIKDLAARAGDGGLAVQAARNAWLLPLLASFGCAVAGAGPLIAWAMHLSMLARARYLVERERLVGLSLRSGIIGPIGEMPSPADPTLRQKNGPVI